MTTLATHRAKHLHDEEQRRRHAAASAPMLLPTAFIRSKAEPDGPAFKLNDVDLNNVISADEPFTITDQGACALIKATLIVGSVDAKLGTPAHREHQ